MTADQAGLVERLRERLKLKYAGDCKCGNCHLVDIADIAAAADFVEIVEAAEALSRPAGSGVPEGWKPTAIDLAKAMKPALWSDDEHIAHRAASPLDVRIARSDSVRLANEVLGRLSASPLSGDGGVAVKALTDAERRILAEAAKGTNTVIGIHRPGKFKGVVKRLVESGLLLHAGPDTVQITPKGRSALAAPVPSPAEPVAWEYRQKTPGGVWMDWKPCSHEQRRDIEYHGELYGLASEVRALYTRPSAAPVSQSDGLVRALEDVRAAILEADPEVITCTVWLPQRISPNETAVDHIDLALEAHRASTEGGRV